MHHLFHPELMQKAFTANHDNHCDLLKQGHLLLFNHNHGKYFILLFLKSKVFIIFNL